MPANNVIDSSFSNVYHLIRVEYFRFAGSCVSGGAVA